MGHSHPKDREFVRFAGEGAACRHHVRQLSDVGRHFVSAATLYLAMILPAKTSKINED